MTWQAVREQFPRQWLLIEAVQARSQADKRVVEDLAVLDTFSDSAIAMRRYAEIHRQSPQRELYVVHTDREALDISERWGFLPRGNEGHKRLWHR